MTLPAEQHASYSAIIDSILDSSDLSTVSTKQIRAQLQDRLGHDISHQKSEVNGVIRERFDEYTARALAKAEQLKTETALTNGAASNGIVKSIEKPPPTDAHNPKVSQSPAKRSADDSELSELEDEPKPKKKKVKQSSVESDAMIAARLQDEENRLARPTRGGASRKRAPAKGSTKKSKKKSAAKIKDDDDSSKESGSDEPKEKKGAFHKPLALSQPLSDLLGETQLSRPQTVKKIWEYVRARDLQDPSDKRQIRCDDALRKVFKSDRVHMFTMNKILSQNLYAIDE